MSRDKQMINELIEIFDEEYERRNLITPHNTAEKLTAKGYRKASKVAEEIFEEIWENADLLYDGYRDIVVITEKDFAELKKKYTEEK